MLISIFFESLKKFVNYMYVGETNNFFDKFWFWRRPRRGRNCPCPLQNLMYDSNTHFNVIHTYFVWLSVKILKFTTTTMYIKENSIATDVHCGCGIFFNNLKSFHTLKNRYIYINDITFPFQLTIFSVSIFKDHKTWKISLKYYGMVRVIIFT